LLCYPVNFFKLTDARTGGFKESLFGVIDRTKTDVGARLLKATILGPPTDLLTITTRQNLVEAFLHSDAADLVNLNETLARLPKLDRLLTGIATLTGGQQHAMSAKARRNIDTLIALKSTLAIFPEIAECTRALAACVETKDKGSASSSKDGSSIFLSAVGDNCTFEASLCLIMLSRLSTLIICTHACRQAIRFINYGTMAGFFEVERQD